jgi:hypothetical protein
MVWSIVMMMADYQTVRQLLVDFPDFREVVEVQVGLIVVALASRQPPPEPECAAVLLLSPALYPNPPWVVSLAPPPHARPQKIL